jgi:hypothetical protein
MLNLDTKNIKLWPDEPKHYFSTLLLEKELKQWLKKNKLGQILNKTAEELPRYGSVVIEKTKDGAELVDLRRLFLDPTVERIKDSRFVTTLHYMTPSQLRETTWDNVDVAIDRFSSNEAQQSYQDSSGNINVMESTPYIKIYKRYGEVPSWWLKGGGEPGTKQGEKMVRALYIVAGADAQMVNEQGQVNGEMGVILYSGKWTKDWPFNDVHYTKIKGRWLGEGIVEKLFDVQVRVNEIKNQRRIAMEIANLHLTQTKDKSIVRNVLEDALPGDVLLVKSELTPVALEERNLAAIKDEETSYLQQADRLSFAYEAVRGDEAQADTLGQTQIAVQQATSVYAFKKENVALFYREFFHDFVLEQLLGDLSEEHIMRFTGGAQELELFDKAAAEVYANDYAMEQMLNKKTVTPEDLEAAKEKAIELYRKTGESRYAKIKKALYDDVKFEFDFMIDGEQANPQAIANSVQQVLGMTMGNQESLNDPRVKMLYYKFAENMGVSPAEIELADQQAVQLQNKQKEEEQKMMAASNPPQMPMAPAQ